MTRRESITEWVRVEKLSISALPNPACSLNQHTLPLAGKDLHVLPTFRLLLGRQVVMSKEGSLRGERHQ